MVTKYKRFRVQLRHVLNLSDHVDIETSLSNIKKNIEISGPNAWILFLACLIASVGLNVNSIPVIIGAMLVSPLMGPITGVGLALGTNNTAVLKQSLKNLAVMTIISLIASCLYFLISPLDLVAPTELLARTNPTIYDVMIAFFGGMAGIIESCRKEKGTVISGVAIATALMPPLCTAGYGLASGNMGYFLGAFYLFLINSVFIALAAYLIVRYLHFPFVQDENPERNRKIKRLISFFTLLIIIPSVYTGVILIIENRFDQNAQRFINENKNINRSYIYDHTIDHDAHPSTLTISFGGEKLSEEDIAKIYRSLKEHKIREDQLIIEQNTSMIQPELDNKEVVKSIFERADMLVKIKDEEISHLKTELNEMKARELPHEQISNEIKAQFSNVLSITITRGIEKTFSSNSREDQILAIIVTEEALTQEQITQLSSWLRVRLDAKNIRIINELYQTKIETSESVEKASGRIAGIQTATAADSTGTTPAK